MISCFFKSHGTLLKQIKGSGVLTKLIKQNIYNDFSYYIYIEREESYIYEIYNEQWTILAGYRFTIGQWDAVGSIQLMVRFTED